MAENKQPVNGEETGADTGKNGENIARPARYEPHAHPMPALSLNQINDERLCHTLAHQPARANSAEDGSTEQKAEQASEALYEVAQAHGVQVSTNETQLLPVDEQGQPTVEVEVAADEVLMVESTLRHSAQPADPVTTSRPVPMTGMIPHVPNSQAAKRFGSVDAEPAGGYKPTVSVATTALPTVGRGSGGRWGVHTLRSFVRATASGAGAPRGIARIAQRQFALKSRREEQAAREAFRREKEHARDALNYALRLAEAMFHYGADAMDVDSAIIAVCSAFGLDSVEVDITNQSVIINYTSDPDIYMESRINRHQGATEERFTHTLVRVVRSSTENYEALAAIYELIHEITEGGITLEVADLRLSEITNRPKPYPPLVIWLANIFGAATLTVALGGGWATGASAAIIFTPVYLLMHWLKKIGMPTFFSMAASAGLMTFLAILLGGEGSLLYRPGTTLSAPLVVAAGLILFLPTSRLVSAVQDAINGFPITAAGRFVSTGMSFLGLVIGIASAVSALAAFGGPTIDIEQTKFVQTDTSTFVVFMLAATAASAVATHTKIAKIGWVMLITAAGLIAYYGYSLMAGVAGTGAGVGRSNTALAAFVIGMFSTYLAYRLHAPQAIFSIPALTFLLPGLAFFRGMYLLTVETNVVIGIASMVTAVSVVIAMAAGVALGNYLMQYLLQRFAPTTASA